MVADADSITDLGLLRHGGVALAAGQRWALSTLGSVLSNLTDPTAFGFG